ncbi:MAG: CheR family methyltransferase [Pseudomonadota bacterium]
MARIPGSWVERRPERFGSPTSPSLSAAHGSVAAAPQILPRAPAPPIANMPGAAPPIAPAEIAEFTQIARSEGGISLSDERGEFLRLRLCRRLRETGCGSFGDYLKLLRNAPANGERRQFLEALTTHTTSFFRESRHYDFMKTHVLPELTSNGIGRQRPIQVWSAACSTGAEIWSAAMLLESHRMPDGRSPDWRCIASDISERILRRAANAVFVEEETVGIPPDLARRYLLRRRPRRPDQACLYRIVPELRERTRFVQANLLALDRAPGISADIAFLRNVLIYFEPQDRLRVARGVAARIRPGGFLFTGHAESLGSAVAELRQEGASIYRRI